MHLRIARKTIRNVNLIRMNIRFISSCIIPPKSPTPLTLQMMKSFSETSSNLSVRLQSAHFLSTELPIRYGYALEILNTLPSDLNNTSGILELISLYTSCLHTIMKMKSPTNEEEDSIFTGMLSEVQKELQKVYPLMSWGLYELKQKRLLEHNPLQEFEEEVLSSALDDFVLYHISGVVLLAQHVVSLYQKGGRIQRFHPENTVTEAISRAISLTKDVYSISPNVHFQLVTPNSQTFEYISTHLHHISFELLKNSLRATIESYIQNNRTSTSLPLLTTNEIRNYCIEHSINSSCFPPVEVILSQQKQNLSLKISDQGGGVSRSLLPRLFMYTYTTASPPKWLLDSIIQRQKIPDMRHHYAGLGYGLPVARIYAKYFGGNIKLYSMEGWGTDAFVSLSHLVDQKEIIL